MRISKRGLAGGLCAVAAVGVVVSFLGYLITLFLFENETLAGIALFLAVVTLGVGTPLIILVSIAELRRYVVLGRTRWHAGVTLWHQLTRDSPPWARRLATWLGYLGAINFTAFFIMTMLGIDIPHTWLRFFSFLGLVFWYDCFIVSLAWFQRLKPNAVL